MVPAPKRLLTRALWLDPLGSQGRARCAFAFYGANSSLHSAARRHGPLAAHAQQDGRMRRIGVFMGADENDPMEGLTSGTGPSARWCLSPAL
jgi:hypothetical protein